MTSIVTHIDIEEVYSNPLKLEINLLAMVNSNIRAFKYNIVDLKPVMFVNDTTRHFFLHLKKGIHDVNNYPFEIINDLLSDKRSYDKNIMQQICTLSKGKFDIQDVVAHVYFIKTRYAVKNAQQMIEYLPRARTTQDIVKIVEFLSSLVSTNKSKSRNDWQKIKNNTKKLTKVFPTNIDAIGKEIGGYYKGDMNFIHGPSSHGKSTLFFWDVSQTIKLHKDLSAKIYLSEMSEEVFMYRLLSKEKRKSLKAHEYEFNDDDVHMLEELYGDRLLIEGGLNVAEITADIIAQQSDMVGIDSLQFLPRDTSQPTTSAILGELNSIQSAINNAGSTAMIVSHLNTTKVNTLIDENKARSNRVALWDSCIPRDDMMEWSSACQKLGRRTIAVLNPGIITNNDYDKNTLFVKLNKNTHGNPGFKVELGINFQLYEIMQRKAI
jgi:viroplasmin and RNaseH domain-containing protein